LDSLIEQKLVKQAAEKTGIEVSEKEIDNAVEDVRKQNNISQDELIVAVTRNGLTYKEYREIVREDIREIKFVSKQFRSRISISNDDIIEYYTQNSTKFQAPATIRLRLIFFSNTDKELMDKRMIAFKEGLGSGEDFADLVRQLSEGPSSANGGDLGDTKEGELSLPIEEAAKKLKPGEISEPIQTTEGITIIQLIERKDAGPRPLEEVEKTIQDILFKKTIDERYKQWLDDTKKTAHIKVLL
ncbi:MAG: peptidyl-prolyl cis-trans isomerase, partial [Deltaproteobacteria bacterium]|nr:peptidyl-prolyl cis-trans isomerase [Deltaproteobacteria bacterium]